MKIGSFVGKVNISLSKDEINTIHNELKMHVEYYMDGVIDYTMRKSTPKVFDEATEYESLIKFKTCPTLRDKDKNTYVPRYIRIKVFKNKGYDENEQGKFFEWEDGFKPTYDKEQYNMSISFIGDWRRYRSPIIEHYVGVTHNDSFFQYGTDLEKDFDFAEPLRYISQFIKNSTKERKSLI